MSFKFYFEFQTQFWVSNSILSFKLIKAPPWVSLLSLSFKFPHPWLINEFQLLHEFQHSPWVVPPGVHNNIWSTISKLLRFPQEVFYKSDNLFHIYLKLVGQSSKSTNELNSIVIISYFAPFLLLIKIVLFTQICRVDC